MDSSDRPLERDLSKAVEEEPVTTLNTGSGEIDNESMLDILSMSISASEENVVCCTRSRQLYILTLSAADLGKVRLHVHVQCMGIWHNVL